MLLNGPRRMPNCEIVDDPLVDLAVTGANIFWVVALGLVAMSIGLLLFLIKRRKQSF